MNRDEYRSWVIKQHWDGIQDVRKMGARAAAELGLASYDDWLRGGDWLNDALEAKRWSIELSNFRARYILGMPVGLPPIGPGIVLP